MRTAAAIFWLSGAFIVYVYVGYPVLLAAFSSLVRRRPRKHGYEPTVSLLIAAHNEADVIADKVRNSLALVYPASKIEIVIASDGSTDGTADIAARTGDARVRVYDYRAHRGKLAVLNATVPNLIGEVIVFSDASSMLDPDAVHRLVANFYDPKVGAVSGVYRVKRIDEAELGRQEDFYWKYETFLKSREARFGAALGAHGSLYAVRRCLYPYPEPGTINDDYVIPVRILQQGYRVEYDKSAVSYEEAREMGGFGRRVRIMAGNFQQLREIVPLLWPPRPLALFFFVSHKAGRVLVPAAMVALGVATLALAESTLYQIALALQLAFYGTAAAGTLWKIRFVPLRLPFYFCMINAAALVAAYRLVFRPHRLAWHR
jgi:cellulose synthase/poly-beta-1,6-N-acetylglucosamine synthase-like glycosyltransferase